jgi:uroporphyrinogen decarboxylase
MLDAVTETVCGYMQELKDAGCDGVLYSINGAIAPPGERGVDEETFRTFLRPFDLRVLEAMEGMVRILHVHGTHVDMRRVLDYPCEVFSVSDRLAGNPSLSHLRTMTDKCLMGGIDETRVHDRSLPELREETRDAVRQTGKRKFILAPGCTSAPQTPEHIWRCVRETSLRL